VATVTPPDLIRTEILPWQPYQIYRGQDRANLKALNTKRLSLSYELSGQFPLPFPFPLQCVHKRIVLTHPKIPCVVSAELPPLSTKQQSTIPYSRGQRTQGVKSAGMQSVKMP
jgi:hypothetical protein